MKTEYLKKGKNGYICPNCGGHMLYEDNQEPGEMATDYWYECTSCHTTAH